MNLEEIFSENQWSLLRGIILIKSTKPGELSDSDSQRVMRILSEFLGGHDSIPDESMVKGELHILDGGWLHPVIRLRGLEKETGRELVGLRWKKKELRGQPVEWCGREMRTELVRPIFKRKGR